MTKYLKHILTFRWPWIVINSYSETNQMQQFLKFIFWIKFYVFRTVPMSIVRCFSLYKQQRYMSYMFAASKLYDIYHCCVYGEKLLMMDRGTVRKNVQFYSKNKFEKLVHLVGFIIRVSPERLITCSYLT